LPKTYAFLTFQRQDDLIDYLCYNLGVKICYNLYAKKLDPKKQDAKKLATTKKLDVKNKIQRIRYMV